MINLRYHIVSITAVFLALGIGLTLGSTFLDRVTVDNLKTQLDTVQERVDATEAENSLLGQRLDAMERRDAEMAQDLAERLVRGHLDDVPVLVVTAEGTDSTMVDRAVATLRGAGADVTGTWVMTSRWLLDDSEEVSQLASVLSIDSEDPDRLRRSASVRLADRLLEASEAPTAASDPEVTGGDEGVSDEGAGDDTTATTVDGGVEGGVEQESDQSEDQVPEPEEPGLAAALEETGFIEYRDLPDGTDRVLLPAAGVRYVFVSGAVPTSGATLIEAALVEELAGDGPAPLLAAQGLVDLETEDGEEASEEDRRTTFVGPIRDGELTGQWVSTVDTLDTAAGLAAMVLAVEDLVVDDLATARVGHYGVAPGASRLLPGPPDDT